MSQFTPPPPPPPPPPYQPIPPTEPGMLGFPARVTRWPTVVGILAIVLGAWGTVCSICPTALPMFQGFLESSLPAGAMKQAKVEEKWIPWVVASGGVAMLIGILEIIGGAGLMRRAAWSPAMLRTWAVLAIIAGLASTLLNYQIELGKNRTVTFTTASGPASMPATLPAQAEKALLGVGMFMGLVYVCAFPVFVLISLGREAIREEIRTWGTA